MGHFRLPWTFVGNCQTKFGQKLETFADLYDCVSKTVKSVYVFKRFLGLARQRRE